MHGPKFVETIAAIVLFIAFASGPAEARGSSVLLFKDAGYRGQSFRVDGPIRDLGELGFNDRASSIRVRAGSWLLCSDADFRGRCIVVDGDIPDFSAMGLNDQISSIRPYDGRNYGGGYGGYSGDDDGDYGRGYGRGYGYDQDYAGRGGIVLYQDAGFSGRSIALDRDEVDLGRIGFNDKASSVSVGYGVWLLCEHAQFQGRCITVNGDVGDLGRYRLNDQISSVRRIR